MYHVCFFPNASKTDVILLGRKATLEPLNFPGICVEGELVSPSKCVRDLGLHLDQSLSMEPHVNKIRAAVFSRFRTLGRVRKLLTPFHRRLVVNSLVLSHFNFCASLLAGIEQKHINKLQSCYNAAMRLVRGAQRGSHLCSDAEDPLSVRQHFYLRVLLLLRKTLKTGQPCYLNQSLQPYVPGRLLRSSEANLLVIHRTRLKVTDRAFCALAPRLWNALSPDCRDLEAYDFAAKCAQWLQSRSSIS